MTVDCVLEDERWDIVHLSALANQAEDAVFARLGLEPSVFEICVMGCDDTRIATLNTDFRGKPQSTNVLSWPSEERAATMPGEMPRPPSPDATGETELGDIAISFDTCERESLSGGLTLADHTTHLLIHGILHLLGFDHVRDADAVLMEGLETEILGNLGIADPYSEQNEASR